jgi:hypothetical protein
MKDEESAKGMLRKEHAFWLPGRLAQTLTRR